MPTSPWKERRTRPSGRFFEGAGRPTRRPDRTLHAEISTDRPGPLAPRPWIERLRSVERASWRRLALAAGTVFVLWFLFGRERGAWTALRLRGDAVDLQSEIQRLEVENRSLSAEVRDAAKSPEMIEKKAREELEMVRPGEVVYYYTDPKAPKGPRSPARRGTP